MTKQSIIDELTRLYDENERLASEKAASKSAESNASQLADVCKDAGFEKIFNDAMFFASDYPHALEKDGSAVDFSKWLDEVRASAISYSYSYLLENLSLKKIKECFRSQLLKAYEELKESELAEMKSDMRNASISDLHLSARIENALKAHGIVCAEEVESMLQQDAYALMRMKHLGKKSEAELLEALESHGFKTNQEKRRATAAKRESMH